MNESLQRLLILVMGGIAGLCIVGIVVYSFTGKEPPAGLFMLATGAVGFLSGLIVPTKGDPHGPLSVPVQVTPGLPPSAVVSPKP